jgi:replicative DNA helicase
MSALLASPDAEAAVLGAIMIDPNLIVPASEELTPADFAIPVYVWLAEAAWRCLERKTPPTVPALIEQLKSAQRWSETPNPEAVTYPDFQQLMRCVSDVNIAFIKQHVKIIRELAFRRKGDVRLRQAAQLFLDTQHTPEDIQANCNSIISDVFNRHDARDPSLVSIDQEEEARLARGDVQAIPCGLKWLDNTVGGLLPSENWIIDGPYKSRKTTVLLNMLLEAARMAPVSIFTNGDSTRNSTQRKLLAMIMNQEAIKYGWHEYHVMSSQTLMHALTEERYIKLRDHARGILNKLPIRLYDGRDLVGNLAEVSRLLRRDHALYGTRLWAYDYAQTINHGQTDYERVVYYAAWCQNINGELGCTSITLSQVSEAGIGTNMNDSYSPMSKGGGALPAMANVYLKVSYVEPIIKVQLKLARDAPMGTVAPHHCQPASGLILDKGMTL